MKLKLLGCNRTISSTILDCKCYEGWALGVTQEVELLEEAKETTTIQSIRSKRSKKETIQAIYYNKVRF